MKPNFSDEQIEHLKSIVDNKDLIQDSDKDKILIMRSHMDSDNFMMAQLFVKCYNYLSMIKDFLYDEEKDFRKPIQEYLDYLQDKTNVEKIHQSIRKYQELSGGIGSHDLKLKIFIAVNENKKEVIDFINFFIKIGDITE